MNRQNFLGHLALALTVILVAALLGQMRRWQKENPAPQASQTRQEETVEIDEREDAADADADGRAEVLVRFRARTTADEVKRLTEALNDRVEDRFEFVQNYAVIEDEDGLDAAEVARQYMRQPEVEYAEPNFQIELDPAEDDSAEEAAEELERPLTATPNDPLLGEQWALINTGQRNGKAKADINALKAWLDKTTGSDRVVVAVLDSGVNYAHQDLVNNIWTRPASLAPYADAELGTIDDAHGYDALENDGDPMDENGHGTHCAGIVGAEGNNGEGITGVNWKVQIMPLRFMDANGMGTTKDAIEAINYVIERKKAGVNVRVINASWGSTRYSRALEDAIRRAGEEGILFVAASGNSSVNTDNSPHYPSSYALANVISVAALNRRDELASFSNYGPKTVHLAAPGAEILSTWLEGTYEEHSGTSMATPVVSGVAALVLSNEPNLSVKDLRERLFKSVDRLDALNGKIVTGGRINAARAVGAE